MAHHELRLIKLGPSWFNLGFYSHCTCGWNSGGLGMSKKKACKGYHKHKLD